MSFTINVPEGAVSSAPSTDLGPVPKGTYNVTVFDVKTEEVRSGANAGKPRWNVQLRISEGQYENRRLFVYIPLYVAGDFWKTQSFFESMGYSVSGEFKVPAPAEVLGKSLSARVAIREPENGYPADNNVSGFGKVESAEDMLKSMGATPKEELWAE